MFLVIFNGISVFGNFSWDLHNSRLDCVVITQLFPKQKIGVRIRSDASQPVTKLRIGTASAGGTHSLACRTKLPYSHFSALVA